MTIESRIKVDFGDQIKSSYDFISRHIPKYESSICDEVIKEKYNLDYICDHDLIVQIGQTDKEITDECFEGVIHFYINCLVCSTTMLRDESFYQGYKYRGIDLTQGPMFIRKDFNNEYGRLK